MAARVSRAIASMRRGASGSAESTTRLAAWPSWSVCCAASAASKPKKLESFVVFGASRFAVRSLEALAEAGFEPGAIYTQKVMDTETWKRTKMSPVSRWAKKNDRAATVADGSNQDKWLPGLLDAPPDLVLTLGLDTPLPEELWTAPRLGCIGIHASNLPKYRGANPLRAIIGAGENTTGVTAYRIEGADWDGPILFNEQMDIGPDEVYGDLVPRVSELFGQVTLKVVEKLAKGSKLQEKKQDDKRSSQSSRVDRRHRRAPWWLTAKEVYDRLRAYSPEPGLETFIGAKRVEVLSGQPMDWMKPTFGDTGTFLGIRSGRVAVLCDQSTVFGIDRLRLLGGEPQGAADYARQVELSVGSGLV